MQTIWACKINNTRGLHCFFFVFFFLIWRWFMLFEMYCNMLNVWFLQLMPATCQTQTDRKTDRSIDLLQTDRKTDRSMKTAMQMWTRLGIALCKLIMVTTKVDLAPEEPFSLFIKHRWPCTWMKMACTYTCSKYESFFFFFFFFFFLTTDYRHISV